MHLRRTLDAYLGALGPHLRIGLAWVLCQAVLFLALANAPGGIERFRDFWPLIPILFITAFARAGLLGSLVHLRSTGESSFQGFFHEARLCYGPMLRQGFILALFTTTIGVVGAVLLGAISRALGARLGVPGALLGLLLLTTLYIWITLYLVTYPGYLLAQGASSARGALLEGWEAFWRQPLQAVRVLPVGLLFLSPYLLAIYLRGDDGLLPWLALLQWVGAPFTTRYWLDRWDAVHHQGG